MIFRKTGNWLLCMCTLLLIQNPIMQAQDKPTEPKFNVKFHGFVNHEIVYDTRQTVSAREGEVLLYPAPINKDLLGRDKNNVPNLHMFTFHSRLKSQITGPDAGQFKTSGWIEVDFLGANETSVNLIRLRHAFFKLSSENLTILFGQYWHPMFNPECYPEVVSWNGALPIHPLSRNPQIRVTYSPSDLLKISGSLLSHRDFATRGPEGTSSSYLKNSGLPEFQGQLSLYPVDKLLAGFTLGYKTIVPRKVSELDLVVDESISSFNSNAFLKYSTDKFYFKTQVVYGENMSNMLMLGGYGIRSIQDEALIERSYMNTRTGSIWSEVSVKINKMELAVFAGMTQNMGSKERTVYSPESPVYYGLGNDIKSVLRISPRISFSPSNLKFTFEVISDDAEYGNIEPDLTVSNTHHAKNTRLLFSSTYSF